MSGLRSGVNAALTSGPDDRGRDVCRLTLVERTDATAQAEWDRYVAASPRAELYHDYRWRTLIESVFGHACHYWSARDAAGRISGVLPLVRLKSLLFGDFFVSLPYLNYGGVLGDSAAVEQALVEAAVEKCRQLGAQHIELRHRAPQALPLSAREDKITMLLDLPESQEELWKSFEGKLRSQIRRPEKAGATFRLGGQELIDDFYVVFERNMRDLGTPVYPKRFFSSIAATFSEHARVCIVDLAGAPAAAGLALTHRSTMQIPWASSLRDANRLGVNMLLYWVLLRDAIARGHRTFDFGRTTRGSGTHKFKEQWGARAQQLRWHYWLRTGDALPQLTPNNPKYGAAIALWKKLPVPMARFLGPRIVKYLP